MYTKQKIINMNFIKALHIVTRLLVYLAFIFIG
jgi:hypothetical protein